MFDFVHLIKPLPRNFRANIVSSENNTDAFFLNGKTLPFHREYRSNTYFRTCAALFAPLSRAEYCPLSAKSEL